MAGDKEPNETLGGSWTASYAPPPCQDTQLGPGSHFGEVARPDPVGCRGGEVAAYQVGALMARIADRGKGFGPAM